MLARLREIFSELAPDCLHCRRASPFALCINCQSDLMIRDIRVPLVSERKSWSKMSWGFRYEGGSVELLHRMKDSHQPETYRELVNLQLPNPGSYSGITVVPSDPALLKTRGFDSSDALGRILSRIWGLPFLGHTLRRRSFLESQKGLNRQERQQFIGQNLRLCPSWVGRRLDSILLVDDLMTTGASLDAAAERLAVISARVDAFALFKAP